MKYKQDAGDVPPSIKLDIREHRGGVGGGAGIGDGGGGGSTSFFEPKRERTPGGHGASGRGGEREPPEKRLTLFALRLAVLEKAASGLGTLDFVWATVVLLGGFASSLRITDFWCVTVILVGEGARVFSRSHELEWQHHATQTSSSSSAAAADARGFQRRVAASRKDRAWHAPDVPLLPYTGWVFVSRKIGRLLNWLQVLSAAACVALSLFRLWRHDFGFGNGARNKRPALLLFYTLALLEATLFLLEKAYWAWKLSVRKLLHQVSADCELGPYGTAALTRFFYDAYSRCIAGSIFDGVKMDLVTFAEDLLMSDFLDEQLIGVRILQQFANNERGTMREVGTSPRAVERLVEMLSWKRPDEEEVRRCAAEVVARLAGSRQNALRVSAIPGAIESVLSLLHTGAPPHGAADEASPPSGGSGYDHLPFNLLGLLILERLAEDHDNCGKIGGTRGLLAKIIDFTRPPPVLLCDPHAALVVKRALRVVKMLVSATGSTGKALRREVAENVFTVSNLRGVLQHGQRHWKLQKLAMDVLTALAMEDDGKEAIVGTGGVVTLLLSIFAGAEDADADRELGCEAGEALAMLALESERGCAAILRSGSRAGGDVLDHLLPTFLQQDAAGDARRLNAARLLRNLCAYSAAAEHREQLRAAATRALPAALHATMAEPESDKVLEVSVGLTTEICRFVGGGELFGAELRGAGVEERAYVERLATFLRRYRYPEIRVPRMRRFVVQQVVWLVTSSGSSGGGRGGGYVELMREVGMERLLESVADTTSRLEWYHVFSGSVGIGKHRENLSTMVDSAIELLAGRGGSQAEE